MQRIVVVAARGPVYRKLIAVVTLDLRDPDAFLRRLPAVYLTLAGTDADADRIAATIRRRLRPVGVRSS
jgi:hypothetical protein